MELYKDLGMHYPTQDSSTGQYADVPQQNPSYANDPPPYNERQQPDPAPYPQANYPPGSYPQGVYPPGPHPQALHSQGSHPQSSYGQGSYPPESNPQGSYPEGSAPQQTRATYASTYPQSQIQYAQNQQVVVAQSRPQIEQVESYICWSIFNCLCCCWLLGLVAICVSCSVTSLRDAGEIELARSRSLTARGLNIASTVLGIIIIILLIAFQFAS